MSCLSHCPDSTTPSLSHPPHATIPSHPPHATNPSTCHHPFTPSTCHQSLHTLHMPPTPPHATIPSHPPHATIPPHATNPFTPSTCHQSLHTLHMPPIPPHATKQTPSTCHQGVHLSTLHMPPNQHATKPTCHQTNMPPNQHPPHATKACTSAPFFPAAHAIQNFDRGDLSRFPAATTPSLSYPAARCHQAPSRCHQALSSATLQHPSFQPPTLSRYSTEGTSHNTQPLTPCCQVPPSSEQVPPSSEQ